MAKLSVAKVPCGSCPYRRDVPSGIWEQHEYDKLPEYDGQTWEQNPALFLCHQRDGNLCAGWLACHDPRQLLALRFAAMNNEVDQTVLGYKTDVPVFATGTAARAHGMHGIRHPGNKANKMIAGLVRKRRLTAS